MSERVLTSFKLKDPNLINRRLERALGDGHGARIEFRDRPGIPIDWDPPFVFYVNNIDVGFLSGDVLKVDVECVKKHKLDVYEKILGIADQVIEKINGHPVSPEILLFWNFIKDHLELEGLEKVRDLYPNLRDEAELLARPKRLVSEFKKIVRRPGSMPVG